MSSTVKITLDPTSVFPAEFYKRADAAASQIVAGNSRDVITPIMANVFDDLSGVSDDVKSMIFDIQADYIEFRAGGNPKEVATKIASQLKGKEAQALAVEYIMCPTKGEALQVLPKLVSAMHRQDKNGIFIPMIATLLSCGFSSERISEGMELFGDGFKFKIEGKTESGCCVEVEVSSEPQSETRTASDDDVSETVVVFPSRRGTCSKLAGGMAWFASNVFNFFADLLKNVFDWGLKGLTAGGVFGGTAGAYLQGPHGALAGSFYGGLIGGTVSAQLAVAHTVLHRNGKMLSDISVWMGSSNVWLGPIVDEDGTHRDEAMCDMPWVNC